MSGAIIERRRALSTVEICAFETGAGSPAIFLHGITANGRGWDPVTAALSDRFHCVAIDQRGHGRSAKPAGDCYRGADFAADVAALVDDLDAGPALLVGHSLGARNAIVAGAVYPDKISAVIAIEFTPFVETEIFDALDARVGGGDRAFASSEEIEAYLHDRYPMMPADAVSRRAQWGFGRDRDGALRPLADGDAMRSTSRGLRENLEDVVGALSMPTLLVRGAVSRFVTAAAFARSCALRPDLPSVIVEDSDHYVPETQPQRTAALIADFSRDLN